MIRLGDNQKEKKRKEKKKKKKPKQLHFYYLNLCYNKLEIEHM